MKTCLFISVVMMMVALLSHAKTLQKSQICNGNGFRGGALEPISIKQRDQYLYNLWELYNNSSSSERPKAAERILDAVTKIVYLETRIDMLGLLLFGARTHLSVLGSVRDENLPLVDDEPCLTSTMELFEKHCGVLNERMNRSLANICNHVSDKAAIEEAILVVCAMHTAESHGNIDVGNPKIDFTPAPIHGTSQYCGRVSIDGISRMKLQSYAKAYQVKLVPSEPERYDHLIQICFHRNDSLGLCECEKDEWRSVQKGSWCSTMSPYEQRFVDVKFIVQLSDDGYVTITLDEVWQGWRYVLLAGGIALPFMAVRKDLFDEYVDDGIVEFAKWAMRVLALACIFMSSIDTPLALVAVCSCVALCYVTSILSPPKLPKKTKFWPPGQGTADALKSREPVAELASSPEFHKWLIRNTHRIKLRPKN